MKHTQPIDKQTAYGDPNESMSQNKKRHFSKNRSEIYVGNLPLETSFMDVIQHFEKYGEILECNIKEKKWNAFAFIVN